MWLDSLAEERGRMTTRHKDSKAQLGAQGAGETFSVALGGFRKFTRWKLQDAKNCFSEVVQNAVDGEPQCVSRHGKDAVLVISYDALLKAALPKRSLADFFLDSPLAGLDVDFERVNGEYREIDL